LSDVKGLSEASLWEVAALVVESKHVLGFRTFTQVSDLSETTNEDLHLPPEEPKNHV
jgi:hypothetical protein